MFGTIAHLQPKPGHAAAVSELLDEWHRTIRPTLGGRVVELNGRSAARPDDRIAIVAMADEATYRALAASPEQDAWYRRLRDHLERDPDWEDISWETVRAGE